MPRVSLTLVVAALLGVLLIGAGIAWFEYRSNTFSAEGKVFVDHELPMLAANYSTDRLLAEATPEFRRQARPEDLVGVARNLQMLGQYWRYLGSDPDAHVSYLARTGDPAEARYQAKAVFSGGLATFELAVVRRDGHWMIDRFHVDVLALPAFGHNG